MSHYNQYQPPQLLRNSYSHQDTPLILRNPQPPQTNTQNKPPQLNPKDVKQTLKKFNSTIEKIQTRRKIVTQSSSNPTQSAQRHQQYAMQNERKAEQAQKQIDLRGSCPNIYRKIQQFNLRNTTHINNSTRLNYDGQRVQQHPYQFYKPINQEQMEKHQAEQQYWQSQQQYQHYNQFPKNADFQKKCHSQITTPNFTFSTQNEESIKNSSSNSSFPSNTKAQLFSSLNDIVAQKERKKNQQKTLKKEKSPVLNGFQIGRILGRGKFGQVYLGRHKASGFIVALKKIVKSKVAQYKMVQQFKQEIKLHSALNHPNIVKFFGMFQHSDEVYLVLQYMNGGTLFDYLAQKDTLTLQQTADFLRDTILALQYMHDKSIAHRDIKPQNIVLSSEKVAKLCDFGWSALVQSSRKTYCGTFDYAPPQILQRKQYDQSVDLWCIGILTYELLTGKVPFQGQVRKDVMSKIINVDKTKIDFPSDIPQSAKDFIEKLVQKDPNQRPKCRDLLKHKFFIDYPAITTKKHKI